jgi:hypothetical protein
LALSNSAKEVEGHQASLTGSWSASIMPELARARQWVRVSAR